MLELVSTPARTRGLFTSKWVAVWHPVVFTFGRCDAEIVDVGGADTSPDGLEITLDDTYAEVQVGNMVYVDVTLNTIPDEISGLFEVLSVDTVAGKTVISIDATMPDAAESEATFDQIVVISFGGAGTFNMTVSTNFGYSHTFTGLTSEDDALNQFVAHFNASSYGAKSQIAWNAGTNHMTGVGQGQGSAINGWAFSLGCIGATVPFGSVFSFSGGVSDTVSGCVNFTDTRTFYKLEVRVLKYDEDFANPVEHAVGVFTPSPTGVIKADLQRFLQTLMNLKDSSYDYVSVSQDAQLGQPFNIQWREYWKEDGYTAWSDLDDDNIHYIVNAVKRVGDTYGQNMAECVPFNDDTRGKFLSKFEKLKYYRGYPLDLSFLFDPAFVGFNALTVFMNYFTSAGVNTNDVLNVEDNKGFVGRVPVKTWFVPDGTARMFVSLESSSPTGTMVEPIEIEVEPCVPANPMYLRWLNPSGGFDYWMFSKRQIFTDSTSAEKTVQPYIEDLATSFGTDDVISKEVSEEVSVGAEGLTTQQCEGLRYLLRSVFVSRYMGSNEGIPIWQQIRVKTGSFQIQDNNQLLSDLELKLVLPQPYNQQQ